MNDLTLHTPLQPGDILKVDSGLYRHYGVYVGKDQVIHYKGNNDEEINLNAQIALTHLAVFSKGREVEVVQFSEEIFSPQEIVNRAYSRLGEQGYHLVTNNCEHFALWCATGKNQSRQVDKTVAFTSVGAIVGAGLGNLATNKEDNKQTQTAKALIGTLAGAGLGLLGSILVKERH